MSEYDIYYAHQLVKGETLTPRTTGGDVRITYNEYLRKPCNGTTTGSIHMKGKKVAFFFEKKENEFEIVLEGQPENRPVKVEFNKLGRLVVLWMKRLCPEEATVAVDYEYMM